MPRPMWALVMFAAMFVALSVAGIAYTGHERRQSDKRWCDLLTTVDQPDRPIPSTGDSQRDAANRKAQQQLHQLRIDLGCEKE